MVLREAIGKTSYDWKSDGPDQASAIMRIMQNTGVEVFDPGTRRHYRRLDLTAALRHIFRDAP